MINRLGLVIHIFGFLAISQVVSADPRFLSITTEDGLSNNTITSIVQDKKGLIWIGTYGGLNRYDGHSFKVFGHVPEDPNSLPANEIQTIFVDSKGIFWIGTYQSGLSKFDPETEQFTNYQLGESSSGKGGVTVLAIVEDSQGNIWAGTLYQGLKMFNPKTGQIVHYRHDINNSDSLSRGPIYSLYLDDKDVLWIGTHNGLNRLDPITTKFILYEGDSSGTNKGSAWPKNLWTIKPDTNGNLIIGTLGSGLIYFDIEKERFTNLIDKEKIYSFLSITHKDKEHLWVASRTNGLSLFNRMSGEISSNLYDSESDSSLNSNNARFLLYDSAGDLWIGSDKGINIFSSSHNNFNQGIKATRIKNTTRGKEVNSILEDEHSRLWLGTAKGVLRFEEDGNYTQILMNIGIDSADNIVLCLSKNRNGTIIAGTSTGIFVYDKKADAFNKLKVEGIESFGAFTYCIADDKGEFWLGSFSQQLMSYDASMDTFSFHGNIEPDKKNIVWRILTIGTKDSLWIGTDFGLRQFDLRTRTHVQDPDNKSKPRLYLKGVVNGLYLNDSGELWVGLLGEGVKIFNPDTGELKSYDTKNGLNDASIVSIAEDNRGVMWFATNNGMSRFDPNTEVFTNYYVSDGLVSNSFKENAVTKTQSGELVFGSKEGAVYFNPSIFEADLNPPRLVLSDLYLNNRTVPVVNKQLNDVGQTIYALEKTISALDSITLTDKEEFVSFEFSALNYVHADKIQYAFKLSGVNQNWIYTDSKNRLATYSDIPPGEHIFQVKATNAQGEWSDDILSLEVIKLPPWWRSWWAYSIYSLIVVLAIFAFVQSQRKKLSYEKAINRRLREADKLKDEFLANTSHELRTPLNGIVGLTESLIDGACGPILDQVRTNLEMTVSSGRRLSNLVDDILDFSRLRNHSLELYLQPIDLYSLVDMVLMLNQPLIGDKPVELVNEIPKNFIAVVADENRLQQIFHNLVGNAVKFTHTGEIRISAKIIDIEFVQVQVSDTGIGIDENQQNKIFDSFHQVDGSIGRIYGGTGLGLSVTRSLVKLHGGNIGVESIRGLGSCFGFTLPKSLEPAHSKVLLRTKTMIKSKGHEISSTEIIGTGEVENSWRLLIVDDDPINRQVVVNQLFNQGFQLKLASGGEDALALLEQESFDLILLDVMMPVMTGFEVCKRIRRTRTIEELPIIFLTAKNQEVDLVEGFGIGANDYLTKPLVRHELLSRIKLHLKLLDINRNLDRKVKERAEDIIRIAKIGREISSGLDLETSLEKVYKQLKTMMTVDQFGVGLYQAKQNRIYYPYIVSYDAHHKPYYRSMDNKQQFSVWCIEQHQSILINNVYKEGHLYLKGIKCEKDETGCYVIEQGKRCRIPASQIYVPIENDSEILGVMSVHGLDWDQYQPVHVDLLRSITAYVSIVLKNIDIYEKLKISYNKIEKLSMTESTNNSEG